MFKQFILNDELLDLVFWVVSQTEGIEGSLLRLEEIFQNFILAHSDVVMSGSHFLPIG